MPKSDTNRRDFVIGTAGLTAASWAALASPATAASEHTERLIQPGDTILFQGDSITDSFRSRDPEAAINHQPSLGHGYAWMAAAKMLVDQPEDKLTFHNRAVSGNKVFQLADRWQEDCLDLKPDVLSILIGVNDLWHKLDGKYDGTLDIYEGDYRELLSRTKKTLPDVKLVICEPFVLRCGAVNEKWFPEFDEIREASRRVADANGACFVPFQEKFDEAVQYAPPEHWAEDGVHPTPFGYALMAQVWQAATGA